MDVISEKEKVVREAGTLVEEPRWHGEVSKPMSRERDGCCQEFRHSEGSIWTLSDASRVDVNWLGTLGKKTREQ